MSAPVKVVYDAGFGGFSLSALAIEKLREAGFDADGGDRDLCRHDPLLVRIVEELGEAAWGPCAHLAVATLKGRRYQIQECDGWEFVVDPEDENGWTEVPE